MVVALFAVLLAVLIALAVLSAANHTTTTKTGGAGVDQLFHTDAHKSDVTHDSTQGDSMQSVEPEADITPVTEELEVVADEEVVEEEPYIQYYTEQDVIDIAKVLYSECRGVPSKTERACVAWTVLNRVDKYKSTVYSVVRKPNQFAFYEDTPVTDSLYRLAKDVLERWNREKNGETDVGRVLPKGYTYFSGADGHNYFRNKYSGSYKVWDYSLKSPYKD